MMWGTFLCYCHSVNANLLLLGLDYFFISYQIVPCLPIIIIILMQCVMFNFWAYYR